MTESVLPAREKEDYHPMDCPACGMSEQYLDWPCERCDFASWNDGPFTWIEEGDFEQKDGVEYRVEEVFVPETETDE